LSFLNLVRSRAERLKKRIVLPEPGDSRVLLAAAELVARGLARPVLVGRHRDILAGARACGADLSGVDTVDPETSPARGRFAAHVLERRRHRGMTEEESRSTVLDPKVFAACLVALGEADGAVAGSSSPTAEVIRAAIYAIGPAAGLKTVSSFMAVDLPHSGFGMDGTLFYADIGTVPAPSSEQLADIAIATADNWRAMTGTEPRVAMLSFSTKGSARHSSVDKVRHGAELARARRPDLAIDGEMQADAALIPEIAKFKGAGGPVGGRANVLIFPDLGAGNICYKITERLAGAQVCGPVLQGLSRPMSDVSRGVDVDGLVNAVAMVSLQAETAAAPAAGI
jgi:phosphate acetyltransferase